MHCQIKHKTTTLMSSNLLLIVLLVLFSLSLTSVYSRSTRDAVSKHDDESYVMATSDHGSSMIVGESLVKARSFQAQLAGPKVFIRKGGGSGFKSSSSRSSKKKHSKKIGPLDVSSLIGIIIAGIVVTILIICIIYFLLAWYKTKKARRIEQGIATEEINGSSGTQTSKTEDHAKTEDHV